MPGRDLNSISRRKRRDGRRAHLQVGIRHDSPRGSIHPNQTRVLRCKFSDLAVQVLRSNRFRAPIRNRAPNCTAYALGVSTVDIRRCMYVVPCELPKHSKSRGARVRCRVERRGPSRCGQVHRRRVFPLPAQPTREVGNLPGAPVAIVVNKLGSSLGGYKRRNSLMP